MLDKFWKIAEQIAWMILSPILLSAFILWLLWPFLLIDAAIIYMIMEAVK